MRVWKTSLAAAIALSLSTSMAACGGGGAAQSGDMPTVQAASEEPAPSVPSEPVAPAASDADSAPHDPYTPSPDDPYPGLIVGSAQPGGPNAAPEFVVDLAALEQYVRASLQATIDGKRNVNSPLSAEQAQTMLEGRFYVDEESLAPGGRPLIDDREIWYETGALSSGEWTEEYGAVMVYVPSGLDVCFDVGGPKPLYPSGHEDINYSLSLGRLLTPDEHGFRTPISQDRAYELWPEDYAKYAQ